MSNTFWWDITRSAGLTAWVFLTLTVVWGALVSGRLVKPQARRWLLDLHPYLGSLGLGALVLHIVGAIADSTVHLRWLDAVVPMSSGWKPLGVTLGVVALWLLVVVEVTSLLRRKLGRRTWKRIHLLSYAMAWLVTLHAAAVGTDLRNRTVSWLALLMVMAATGISVRRALATSGPVDPDRAPARAPRPARPRPTVQPIQVRASRMSSPVEGRSPSVLSAK